MFAVRFDSFFKNAFENYLESILGTKVEAGFVNTKIEKNSLNVVVKDIKIFGKESEVKGDIKVTSIKFSISLKHLIYKKFILYDAFVDGLSFAGEDKKVIEGFKLDETKFGIKEDSGLDFKDYLSRLNKESLSDRNSIPNVDSFLLVQEKAKNFSPQKDLDLDMVGTIDKIQTFFLNLCTDLEKMHKNLNEISYEKQIERIAVLKDEFHRNSDDKEYEEELLVEKQEAEKNVEKLKEYKDLLDKNIYEYSENLKNMDGSTKQDVEIMTAKILGQNFNFKDINKLLLKPEIIKLTEISERFMRVSKRFLLQEQSFQNVNNGMYIDFDKEEAYPKIFIPKITISNVRIDDTDDDYAVILNGVINNVSSSHLQKFNTRPTSFSFASEKGNLHINGSLKNVNRGGQYTMSFQINEFPMKKIDFPHFDYMPSVENAKADVDCELSLNESAFKTNLKVNIKGLEYNLDVSKFDSPLPDIVKLTAYLWHKIEDINIDYFLEVTKEQEYVNEIFSTDRDSILDQRFNNIVITALGNINKNIKNEILDCIEIRKKDLWVEINNKKNRILTEISAKQKKYQTLLEEIEGSLM
jgi:uncharacterized protein (TIGR03545 family)